jgi:membrane protein YdbS with pleckstrin-like domain
MDPGDPHRPGDERRRRPEDDDDDDYGFDDPAYTSSADYSANADYSASTDYSAGADYSSGADYADDDARTQEYGRPEFTDQEREDIENLGGSNRQPRVLPLEDEPTTLVARYLFPTERYRGEWKRHWIHLSTPLSIGAGATLLLGYLAGFLTRQDISGLVTAAVLVWLAVIGWVAWEVFDWYFDRFILTNKRVMVVNGIITRKVAMMPLLRVTDMKYEQSALGRILNYGTFVLESAGQDQALREVKHLPNPNELYLRVVEEMYEPQAVEARLGNDADVGDDA